MDSPVQVEKPRSDGTGGGPAVSESLKPMERRKKRKALDKEKHRAAVAADGEVPPKVAKVDRSAGADTGDRRPPVGPVSGGGLPVHLFMELTSPETSVREAAAEALATELRKSQEDYEKLGESNVGGAAVLPLEAEKDDGLERCAPPVGYAVRRLIRGLASSRECARQGFSLGLTVVVGTIPAIKVDSIMKLAVQFLEVSSSKKGQDLRDCLLGRLFAYGALVRSGRIAAECSSKDKAPNVKEIVSQLIYLAGKKRYLREPAVSIILDLVDKRGLAIGNKKMSPARFRRRDPWPCEPLRDGDARLVLRDDTCAMLQTLSGWPAAMRSVVEVSCTRSRLPVGALSNQIIENDGMHEWFEKAHEVGDPDALLLALKLQERVSLDCSMFGKLLPHPFSTNAFFTREHLALLLPCFKLKYSAMKNILDGHSWLYEVLNMTMLEHKVYTILLSPFFGVYHMIGKSTDFQESTFCLPRLHSLWHVLIDILIPAVAFQDEGLSSRQNCSKKQKKTRKGDSFEEIANNFHCFYDVVIEGSLLLSSHERKHLVFDILLILLPKLPAAWIPVVLSNKLVHCLMDILSTKSSWLYNAAKNLLKELINWVGSDDDRRVAVIVSLQKHSNGKFDCITQTHTVKDFISKFVTVPGRMLFAQNLMSLFVDEGSLTEEPSEASQTTDENSERGSPEGKDTSGISGNADFLKSWIIDTLPRVLKTLKVDARADSSDSLEIRNLLEAKFRLQTDIMKFLAVQGLFSASLGTEVTSFELQEKFTWPKVATSSSLCKSCIEQLQLLMEDAQRGDGSHLVPNGSESNDLGSFFICFLNTMCNIPSVSLFRALSNEDEKGFKELQVMETRLYHEERRIGPSSEANKLRAVRYLLVQLLLELLLHPGELSEAVAEIIICCKKAFPGATQFESVDEEDVLDDNDNPELLDVLVDNLLSLLPQSSGPMFYAVEQVFRFFCDDITNDGLRRMLHVVKKDLKPPRHQVADTDDEDDEEDLFGIEDMEEINEPEAVESEDSDDHVDNSEAVFVVESHKDGNEKEEPLASDAYDSDMDDDAMFLMDSYIAQLLKDRKNSSGNDTAQSQLMLFKLRVLSLLEIYLQRNPGKPQVLVVYSYLVQAFVNSHSSEAQKQLGARIGGILHKKILKAKEHPRGKEVQISSLEALLRKSVRLASRSRIKAISLLAEKTTFWILKIINSSNFPGSELEKVFEVFRLFLIDYFDNKKSRLKSSFIKEVFRRHLWIAHELFDLVLEKCGSAKSEFRRIEALDLVDLTLKSLILSHKVDKDEDASRKSKLLKKHLPSFSQLISQLLIKFPEKQSRRVEVRRFCCKILNTYASHGLLKSFIKKLTPEAYSSCESKLGDHFLPFKKLAR
ncbi:hypothetical protein Taro_012548 [Colocasia esculenta]|uniref:DNA polymerase V n=1 Tax=Colocasia esculenta TaxID=4460 RepID=A0A843U9H1_COLES|nr:hypothetical protein [Colocasia esculenta]